MLEPAAPKGAAVDRRRLDEALPRYLLAEAARRSGTLKQEDVAARIRAAEREILAQVYLDQQLTAAADEVALRQLYEERRDSLKKKQVHVRHIVIHRADEGDQDSRIATQARINEIYAKVVGGESFEAVARERSEDPASGAKGGDLGTLFEGQVDSVFFSSVAALKRGEISKPFSTAFGHHVAQAVEDPQLVVPAFEEIRGRLAVEARQAAQAMLLERLRGEIDVRVYEKRLAAEQTQERP
ncbi:MAG: peptidylprolyl isomerase [Deltaproteobacteria bacterium]|nr:peptidylprolyl isomerase [Deltaproteobacteria bacterium]